MRDAQSGAITSKEGGITEHPGAHVNTQRQARESPGCQWHTWVVAFLVVRRATLELLAPPPRRSQEGVRS